MIEEREKLLTCLADEYKILQDKIDKIGGFRFTIKGWSLTLIVATLVAGTATKVSPNWIVSAVMAVFVMVFFAVEKKQTDLSRLFGERARHIESTERECSQGPQTGPDWTNSFGLDMLPALRICSENRGVKESDGVYPGSFPTFSAVVFGEKSENTSRRISGSMRFRFSSSVSLIS